MDVTNNLMLFLKLFFEITCLPAGAQKMGWVKSEFSLNFYSVLILLLSYFCKWRTLLYMYDYEIKTIKDLIYYQYAKVLAKISYNLDDGREMLQRHHGLVKSLFRGFKSTNKSWAEIIEAHITEAQSNNHCVYCGKNGVELNQKPIIPAATKIKDECLTCGKIHSITNQVFICTNCNSSKNDLGLYEYYKKLYPEIHWFSDFIPKLVEKNYLENIYYCHECAGTLDSEDLNRDGELNVLDIDYILHRKFE